MPDNINWGMLQNIQQQNPVQSSTPMAKPAQLPQAPSGGGGGDGGGGGIGGLLSGIGGMLGGGGGGAPIDVGSALANAGQAAMGQGMGTGMGFGNALSSMFGASPVHVANDAIANTLQKAPQASLANSLMGGPPSPIPTNQPQSQNPMSIGGVQGMAQNAFPNNPVMQQVATAQAAQESGLMSGKPSGLASEHNNLFGMSGTDVTMNNKAGNDQHSYKSYESPQASMDDYAHLMSKPRYADVMSAKTPEEAFEALHKAGYATDPNYARSLTDINNKLSQTSAIQRAVHVSSMPGASAMDVANQYVGTGSHSHPEVLQQFFNKSMGQDVNPQTTPWCAAFANSVLMSTGHGGTGSLAAKSFLNYGTATDKPSSGDVVVLNRGGANSGLGHVGFFAGYSDDGSHVKILGGNQSGQVMTKEYPMTSVAGFRQAPSVQELQAKSPQGQQQQAQQQGQGQPQQQGMMQQQGQPQGQPQQQQPGSQPSRPGVQGQQGQGQQSPQGQAGNATIAPHQQVQPYSLPNNMF